VSALHTWQAAPCSPLSISAHACANGHSVQSQALSVSGFHGVSKGVLGSVLGVYFEIHRPYAHAYSHRVAVEEAVVSQTTGT
jgi:hypothetical protein